MSDLGAKCKVEIARRLAVAMALAAIAPLTACNSGEALRGVGAPQASVAGTVAPAAVDEGETTAGIPMHVTRPPVSRDAFVAEEPPAAPDMAQTREEAIQQIRAKAASVKGEKPNIFAVRESRIAPMTPQEQAANAAELEAAAAAAQSRRPLPPAADAQSAKALRKKADSHYEEALERIEN